MNNPIQTQGDQGFIGLNSRMNPLLLPDGFVQRSENMRLDRGTAQVRKGALRVADEVDAADTPLTLSFELAADKSISGITRSGSTATVSCTGHGYLTGQFIEVRGADQSAYNGDVQITVINANSFSYAVTGTPSTPATGTMFANGGPILETIYGGGVLVAGVFSSPGVEAGAEFIVLAGMDAAFLWRDGVGLITKAYPTSPDETIAIDDDVSILQAFDRLFVLRSQPLDGDFRRIAVSSLTRSGTTATASCTAHGLVTGRRVRIEGATPDGWNTEFDVTVTDANNFTFTVPNTLTTPATGTITSRRVHAPLYWDGGSGGFVRSAAGVHPVGDTYRRMPSSSIATYFNNQVCIVPTPMRDSVLVSDVLDSDSYDPLLKSFRANAGSADRIVALHPYADGTLLIFMRNSIYLAKIVVSGSGDSIDPALSFIELLTNEIGCRARRSIVTAGQYVYFLSDSGVYRLDSNFADLRLRGNTLPLSDAVANLFDDVNEEYAYRSCAAYFNNRYYIAIPTGDAEEPNSLLVFNTLNDAWESKDSFSIQVHNLIVSEYESRRRLFAAGRSGYLFLLEEREDGDSQNATDEIDDIAGRLTTRRYSFGKYGPKRMQRALCNVFMPTGGALALSVNLYDPDQTLNLGSIENSGSADDFSVKRGIRTNAHHAEIDITTDGARPSIRSVAVEAIVTEAAADRTSRDTR